MRPSTRPRLIGVIDLMGGVAVRAVGGRRDQYKPVRSRLSDSPDPHRIAEAIHERYGIVELYVADLDALRGGRADLATLAALAREPFRITVDAGLRTADNLEELCDLGIETFVAALETVSGPAVLDRLLERVGPQRLAFSLDLAGGVPLADPAVWGERFWNAAAPLRLSRRIAAAGVEHLIVLDLRAVGSATGPVTADLCRTIKEASSGLRLWSGGGVRTSADARALHRAGADGVLVASALHDRTLDADRHDFA